MITVHEVDFEEKMCSPNCPRLEIEFIREGIDEHHEIVLETCKHIDVCRNAVEQFIKNVGNEVKDNE